VRVVGLALVAVQLILLLGLTALLVHRRAQTWDYSIYQQAAWLIAHGHLDPFSTLLHKKFILNDGELLIWPLAALLRVWPNLALLPWLQDVALAGAECIALGWICELGAREAAGGRGRIACAISALGIVLILASPWTAWTAAFDFHLEPFVALFVMGTARDMYRGRSQAGVWAVMAALCGNVGAGYLFALGVSAMISGRWCVRRGALIACFALAVILGWLVVDAHPVGVLDLFAPIVTGNGTVPRNGLTGITLVKAALEHPFRVIHLIWIHRANIWGVLSPGGVIGVLWLPFTLPILFVVVEGGLGFGPLLGFEVPGFQNVALVTMVAVGTVAVCFKLARRHSLNIGWRRFLLPGAIALLGMNALGWAVVWMPKVERNSLLVSPSAAATIRALDKRVGPSDQVLVSQGISGSFAQRFQINTVKSANVTVPITSRKLWIILAPTQGSEYDNSVAIARVISELDGRSGFHEVVAANGVWAFEMTNAPVGHRFSLSPGKTAFVPGSVTAGQAGKPVREGPPDLWHAASNHKPGYVVSGSYFPAFPGAYRVAVHISVTGRTYANVEVWDSTTSKLLKRTVVRRTRAPEWLTLTVRLRHVVGLPTISGFGIWSTFPYQIHVDNLELRVWSPGSGEVDVYGNIWKQLSGRRYGAAAS
jgi:hypothetical protein